MSTTDSFSQPLSNGNSNSETPQSSYSEEGLLPKDNFPHRYLQHHNAAPQRLAYISSKSGLEPQYLSGKKQIDEFGHFEGNIENFIGLTQVPTGIIGPLYVKGSAWEDDVFVPMATSEGALIASYHRGAKATRLSGGIHSVCLQEMVQRSPVFKFRDLGEVGNFLVWVQGQEDMFRQITSQTSRFAKYLCFRASIEANHIILTFEYHPGDAAGQNMVTLCTDAICRYIAESSPVKAQAWYIESNMSGDKKATAQTFAHTRGKRVSAEARITAEVIKEVLHTSAKAIEDYSRICMGGAVQSGSIGAQAHYANGLAAMFMACGQDVACVAEAAMGLTRMEAHDDGSLYISVTLPNLIVGTVGGGTAMPTQRECLELMDCFGAGKARKFAEICAAVVLAGELSIAGAVTAGHFTRAHKKLGRKKKNL
jgi:hydroxymethylglutaryl-CoA reductase (NADPH)